MSVVLLRKKNDLVYINLGYKSSAQQIRQALLTQ